MVPGVTEVVSGGRSSLVPQLLSARVSLYPRLHVLKAVEAFQVANCSNLQEDRGKHRRANIGSDATGPLAEGSPTSPTSCSER